MNKIILMLGLICLIWSCNDEKQNNSVTFVSWGGSYQVAQDSAYLKNFEINTGVKVKQLSYSGELSKIKEMVTSKKTSWDIVSITQEMFSKGVQSDLFENLDFNKIDTNGFIKGSIYKNGIAHLIFSTVIAYNSEYFKTHPRPTSWKEFWDVRSFPGERSLNDGPVGNLEFALLADGVSADSLYPLDVERAFRKLKEIKSYIKVWWKEGQQPIQLLANNEVQLSTAYNGRVSKAQSDGEKVSIEWNGGMMEPEYFVIPKGAPNKDNANTLIAYATSAKQQQKFVEIIPYGPTNLTTLSLLKDSVLNKLPDSKRNLNGQFLIDGKWWSKNYDQLIVRWNKWKLEK